MTLKEELNRLRTKINNKNEIIKTWNEEQVNKFINEVKEEVPDLTFRIQEYNGIYLYGFKKFLDLFVPFTKPYNKAIRTVAKAIKYYAINELD